jgi:hypothetical protein
VNAPLSHESPPSHSKVDFQLLPRAFGDTAVAFGAASIIMGLAALFSATAFSLAIILIIVDSAWVLAVAGRPGDLTQTGTRAAGGLRAAGSGHRLAHQRLPAAVKEPAMHPLTSAPKARPRTRRSVSEFETGLREKADAASRPVIR